MAERCAFYYYDSSFWSNSSDCCRLLEQKGREYRVGSQWAKEYCERYNHEKCPYFMNRSDMSSGSSGCYLTSACVQAKGLPDDCYELQTLRKFRDTYLSASEEGKTAVHRYYATAPKLVDIMNRQGNSQEIYDDIYTELILPFVRYIETGWNEEAIRLYQSYTSALCEKYGVALED